MVSPAERGAESRHGQDRATVPAVKRAVAALTMVVVWLGPATAKAWPPDVQTASRYASERAGDVSFAVIGPRRVHYSWRASTRVPAASVIKVMFMTAYLRQESVKYRDLRQWERELLGPMIRRSDNPSADRVADMLGPKRMYRLARKAGMRRFHYTRPWGLSTITATDQVRFMFELEQYLPSRHESYARSLLREVVPWQRWGIGRVQHPKWRYFFKGGWGSGSGDVCHQLAFLERGDMRIAAAVMITDSPSHAYATETLEGVFRRLLRYLPKPQSQAARRFAVRLPQALPAPQPRSTARPRALLGA